ncbi:MAG: hypothetical protein Q8R18_06275 [bacterium]|nr:hypothetical protein [bacterium]
MEVTENIGKVVDAIIGDIRSNPQKLIWATNSARNRRDSGLDEQDKTLFGTDFYINIGALVLTQAYGAQLIGIRSADSIQAKVLDSLGLIGTGFVRTISLYDELGRRFYETF